MRRQPDVASIVVSIAAPLVILAVSVMPSVLALIVVIATLRRLRGVPTRQIVSAPEVTP